MSQVPIVMDTLDKFCKMSSLKVSLEKSQALCSPNISRNKKEAISNLMTIRIVYDLGKYLGIPIPKGKVKKATFNPIIEKI